MELIPAWMRSFGEQGGEYKGPMSLSGAQKKWLERAWVSEFGFVPEAVPRYNEQRGFFYVPAVKVHWHHIRGVTISIYHDGEDPHRPTNVVPLSARTHIGRGLGPWEEADGEVIHERALEALRAYSHFKEAGGRNPFEVMGEESRWLAGLGITNHFDLWDRHFEELARRVVSNFAVKAPEDHWPRRVLTG